MGQHQGHTPPPFKKKDLWTYGPHLVSIYICVQVGLDVDVAPDHLFLSLSFSLRVCVVCVCVCAYLLWARVSVLKPNPFSACLCLIPWKLDEAELEIQSNSEKTAACVHLKSVSPVMIWKSYNQTTTVISWSFFFSLQCAQDVSC